MPFGRYIPTSEAEAEQLERRGVAQSVPVRYHYRIYGVKLSSLLELPELPSAKHFLDPDIDILTSELKETLDGGAFKGPWVQVAEESCQFLIEGIARYRIEQGRRILVDRRVPHEDGQWPIAGDVRLYLLGTALGILLHQRHWLPLHVSALQTPSGVWAFTGHSGAGKSTLSAWLHYRLGWPMVSDDVAVIKPTDELPFLYPGPPRLKLWKDALAALEIDRHGLVRDLTRADKYHLMLHKGFQDAPQPLRALVLLEKAEKGEAARLEPVTGAAAFQAIMSSLYRPEFGKEFNSSAQRLYDSARLAGQIDIYRFRRPWSLDEMNASVEPLLQRILQSS